MNKPWKPDKYICCPNCEDILFISSVIPINGQVNFACANNDCSTSGFIHQGKFYFVTDDENSVTPTSSIVTTLKE